MFQGGFVGRVTQLEYIPLLSSSSSQSDSAGNSFQMVEEFYFEDNNALQVAKISSEKDICATKQFRLLFVSSSDFYGRITVYSLNIYGHIVP